jgi:hypothetical protein
VLTAIFSYLGMAILAASVGLEMWENHAARRALLLETSEFPNILSEPLEQKKSEYRGSIETVNN